jgi:hypothetical protein
MPHRSLVSVSTIAITALVAWKLPDAVFTPHPSPR